MKRRGSGPTDLVLLVWGNEKKKSERTQTLVWSQFDSDPMLFLCILLLSLKIIQTTWQG